MVRWSADDSGSSGLRAALGELLTQLRSAAVDGVVPERVFAESVRNLAQGEPERERLRHEPARLGLPVRTVHVHGDRRDGEKVARNCGESAFPRLSPVRQLLARYADADGCCTSGSRGRRGAARRARCAWGRAVAGVHMGAGSGRRAGRRGRSGQYRNLDLGRPGIVIVHRRSAKGLGFDTVVVPDAHEDAATAPTSAAPRMSYYVMATRARWELRLGYEGESEPPLLARVSRGDLQRGWTGAGRPPRTNDGPSRSHTREGPPPATHRRPEPGARDQGSGIRGRRPPSTARCSCPTSARRCR